MKNTILLVCLLLFSTCTFAQDFKFAFITDTNISQENNNSYEDLVNTVNHINQSDDIEFVVIGGNVTEKGDKASLQKAKDALDKLKVKYYAVSGNQETKWSESGGTDFARIFGSERFDFEHNGYRFLGFATGPIVRMMDGHISPQDIVWLNMELSKKRTQPTIVVTHYPLHATDVDNWYQATDVLRLYNVKLILSGHHKRNAKVSYEGIPAFINRANLRDQYDELSGYNVYTVSSDEIAVAEQKVGLKAITWGNYSLRTQHYTKENRKFTRPNLKINQKYPKVKKIWTTSIFKSIYASPTVYKNSVYVGDETGAFYCFSAKNGKELWNYKTDNRIVGSAAANDNVVVFGSTDKTIYGLDAKTGSVKWQYLADAAVLGSATISGNSVYIGASDGTLRAFDVNTGSLQWQHTGVGNYIETKPLVQNGKVIFGAWDEKMYALDQKTGALVWSWKGDTEGMYYSPAAVWPVGTNEKVFFSAPDRQITALNINTGDSIWRLDSHLVRESIGISEDAQRIYSKTMRDSVVCYSAIANTPQQLWTTSIGYGYDNAATMLVEKGGTVFGSTKNGMIFAIEGKSGKLLWVHKIGNSLIGTVHPINRNTCIYVSSEGSIGMIGT